MALFFCTQSVMLDFCFILVASNIVIWATLFGAHRVKLEAEDFIFHVVGFYFPCCSIIQRNFPNFGMEILALRSGKSLRGLYFSLFCSRVVHSCSKIGKNIPKTRIYFLSFSIFRWHVIVNCSHSLKQEVKHSYL